MKSQTPFKIKLNPKFQANLNKKRKISFIVMIADFVLIMIVLLIIIPKMSYFSPIDYKNYQFESKAIEFSGKTLVEFSSKQISTPSINDKTETLTIKLIDNNNNVLLTKDLNLSNTKQSLTIEDFVIEKTGLKTIGLEVYNSQKDLVKKAIIKVRQ